MESKHLKVLKLFANNDKHREWMNVPLYYGNLAVATDSYCVVLTNKKNVDGLESCKNDKIDLSKIIPEYDNHHFLLDLKEIKKAISKIPLEDDYDLIGEDIPCVECESSGEVEWEYETKKRVMKYKYFDCPICKGSGYEAEAKQIPNGKQRPEDGYYISIKNCVFNERLFSKMLKIVDIFNTDKVLLTHQTEYNKSSKFTIADFEIIIMPYVGMEDFSKIIYQQI